MVLDLKEVIVRRFKHLKGVTQESGRKDIKVRGWQPSKASK